MSFAIHEAYVMISKTNPSKEVHAILRSEISHLWPTITKVTALQKECAAVAPQLFLYCEVLHVDTERLVLSAPNAAFASKLKQQLPKLQLALQKAGWQIGAIRIKVQLNPSFSPAAVEKQCHFSPSALNAFDALEKNLGQSHANNDLVGALRTLLERHKNSSAT